MRLGSALHNIAQLCFGFLESGHQEPLPPPPVNAELEREDEVPSPSAEELPENDDQPCGAAPDLEGQCRQLLLDLGMTKATELVKVVWNPRLRSTAGYARYPSWRIELNPLLQGFEGQVDRTLRHELAHLVAYHRAGRRRIEPHGLEWQQACADLGIAGEPAHHRLPLPRSQRQRPHAYQCPSCLIVVNRARPFKHASACLACCRKHSGGQFDARFKFIKLVAEPQQ